MDIKKASYLGIIRAPACDIFTNKRYQIEELKRRGNEMPSKPKTAPAGPALYVAVRPDIEELKKKGAAYAHPRIQVGHGYGDDTPDFFFEEFAVEFQITLQADSAGYLTADGHAYAGHVAELAVEKVNDAASVIKRVLAKVQLLAPDQPDEYFRFIVGLRGAGFKEAVMKVHDSHSIAFLR